MLDIQPGIVNDDSGFHYHLEYKFSDRTGLGDSVDRARQAAKSALPKPGEIVIGIRPSLWRTLRPEHAPANCEDFAGIEGAGQFTAPATQNDVWFWIQSPSHDANFNAAMNVAHALGDTAGLRVDIPGFVRHENRDLTGFVDGSANPEGEDIYSAAFVPAGSPGAGGSFALTQRWVHDLRSFNQLTVGEQEAVIGRTKPDSIELEGEAMPPDSHVSRTDVKLDGVAMKVYRRSVPYGLVDEHGLFFVAFACERRRLQIQLERMYGVTEDGLHDRLIHFSEAKTGSYWFVPAEDELEDFLGN